MKWRIYRTDTFAYHVKKHKSHHLLLIQLRKTITILSDNPLSVGGELSGKLAGKRSVRLARKFRLIFEVDVSKNTVWLLALDHREYVY